MLAVMKAPTMPAAADRPIQRQPGVNRRPSGTSSNTKVVGATTNGTQETWLYGAAMPAKSTGAPAPLSR